MIKLAISAYQEWTAADAKAREAEVKLAGAWRAYFDAGGAPPSDELIQEVARLRVEANERLSMAMAAIGTPKPRDELKR
jgi:hypothetical protein